MRNILLISLLIILAQPLYTYDKSKKNSLLAGSSLGKEFWIAVPPNREVDKDINRAVEIYVSAQVDTKVTLEYPASGFSITKDVSAFSTTTFSSHDNELSYDWEVREDERVSNKGIRIYSEDSVSVYLINSKDYSSDGFLALPVKSLGRDYIHLSYYDYNDMAGGFLIIATEDNTKCGIKLRGKGANISRTSGNSRIGDSLTVTLNKGQTYMVKGNAGTTGDFDLSGSRVSSNKPIGFISFHERTTIPSEWNYSQGSGRDNLAEMLPPVSAWGKKFTTVEFDRQDRGDFFRMVAAFDNTNWKVRYFEIGTGYLIDSYSGTLDRSGDIFEYNQTRIPPKNPFNEKSIRGVSVWEADKPVMLLQYSYSADWDRVESFDPFMVIVVPQEQYVYKTVFQIPEGRVSFNDNFLNVLAVGDPDDPGQTALRSVELDGRELWRISPELLQNRIPETDIYWARIEVSPGAHQIEGDTYLGSYIYGFDDYNSYGWAGAMSFDVINEIDTLAPEIDYSTYCGNHSCTVTELRNGSLEDYPRQVETGIASVRLLRQSYNYELELLTADTILADDIYYEFKFALNVIDKKSDAYAIFEVTDKNGNLITDEFTFSPEDLNTIDFRIIQSENKESFEPGTQGGITILTNSDEWADARIDSVSFNIRYKTVWAKLLGVKYPGSAIDSTWNFNVSESIAPDGYTTLEINGSGSNFVKSDGSLLFLDLFLYLSADSVYKFDFSEINVRDPECYFVESLPCSLIIHGCAQNMRSIIVNKEDFYLQAVSPDPAGKGITKVKYGIGLDCDTEFRIIDILGREHWKFELVGKKTGSYTLNIQTNELPPGTYFLQMNAGPYFKTVRFTVNK